MEVLSYRIDDKTIVELLGNQNFTSDESAILELVKNAYDAKATKLTLAFDNDTLTIVDNGSGMDSDDIRAHWMRVGFSDKEYEVVDENNKIRVLSGSKGIGRFALSKLGTIITMFSKKTGCVGIIWRTDWEKSSVIEDPENQAVGTRIIIGGLRQKWTQKKVHLLRDFLSRTVHDTSMDIFIYYPDTGEERITAYFPEAKPGINCLSVIRLDYDATNRSLTTNIVSDEFTDEARKYCGNKDIKKYFEVNDIMADLRGKLKDRYPEEELSEGLKTLGDFSAEFYFVNHPTNEDMEKFCYKHDKLPETMNEGIVLYRNAFSISSFDGKKDWLGLGKRSRKSTASPSHPTGTWRVRENQISGKVEIDKKENAYLKDISNRQGLEENFQYHLFIDVLLTGISNFERYRQEIIRKINVKIKNEDDNLSQRSTPIADKIIAHPAHIAQLSLEEAAKLAHEITELKEERKNTKREQAEIEDHYRYDVRILNALSTIGLKAASIAHEMRNDRNAIQYNVEYTIKALQEYGMWEELSDPEHTAVKFKNVPQLLNDDSRVSKKLVSFMDTMLADIKKNKFTETTEISACVERICEIWERDYAWVHIHPVIDESVTIQLHEDEIRVILDNLILNSIQQNGKDNVLSIEITAKQKNGVIRFIYKDNGKGLDQKYSTNPRKILEVHETTRPEGHGLGMWIVNNTVTMTGGEIENILPGSGFTIEFTMGGISR